MHRILLPTAMAMLIASAARCGDGSKADLAFFEKKIRPVLVEHCFECHSSDAKELGGSLLLDSKDGVAAGGESGPVVVAGAPDESLLIQSLRYVDLEMPPAGQLSEATIANFEKWIRRGAVDPRVSAPDIDTDIDKSALWSYFPRASPPIPSVKDDAWPLATIDRFVLARMENAGLRPTGDADPRTMIRRLSIDLTGLPPTYEEVETFATDHEKRGRAAIVALVDRLLGSPSFGQRWGRHWLDVARYGESNGDDGLGRNASFPHAWRYRDYVVDSFNDDVPYDRFLTEQIAGDLIPAKNASQRNRQLTATGFLAIGSKPAAAMNKNFAMDVVDDQINAVGSGVLGLSVACARCHDHKQDPISTRDYYALAGIFASTETLYGLAANEKLTAPPTPLHELTDDWIPNAKPIDRSVTPTFPEDYASSIRDRGPSIYESLQDAPKSLTNRSSNPATFATTSHATVKDSVLDGKLGVSAGSYTVAFWFKNDLAIDQRPITAYLFSRAKIGDKQLPGDHLGIGGSHDKSKTGKLFVFNGNKLKQSVGGTTKIPSGTWNHVVMVRRDDHVSVYLNGTLEIDTDLKQSFQEQSDEFRLSARSDKFAPLKGQLAHFAIFDRPLSTDEATSIHTDSGQPVGKKTVTRLAMGVREAPKPGDSKIHVNGDSGKLGPSVPRGFLTAYRSLPKENANLPDIDIPNNASGRRELASWLTDPQHPQTARVIVNRVWLHLFGRGIVTTPDDFGVDGARPSHPQLLDHLANRMVNEGWSIKRLIRQIALSRTYGLDSRADGPSIHADPDNVWLARHHRRRLDAESIRDAMLKASGSMDLRFGDGSPVEAVEQLINWPPGESTDLHIDTNQRSLYLCMLRHSPPDELAAFDLPDGVEVTGARPVTTLPTHALFLLNGRFVIAQSRQLAIEVMDHSMAGDERVAELFRRAIQRRPSKTELEASLAHVGRVFDMLADSGTISEQERRLRSWASLCQAIISTNEFRYVD